MSPQAGVTLLPAAAPPGDQAQRQEADPEQDHRGRLGEGVDESAGRARGFHRRRDDHQESEPTDHDRGGCTRRAGSTGPRFQPLAPDRTACLLTLSTGSTCSAEAQGQLDRSPDCLHLMPGQRAETTDDDRTGDHRDPLGLDDRCDLEAGATKRGVIRAQNHPRVSRRKRRERESPGS